MRPLHPLLQPRWTTFPAAVAAAVVGAGIMAVVLGFRVGGDAFATGVDDIGEAAAALIAAGACAWTARGSEGQFRRAWAFMAASATAWGLGELAWSVYEVWLKVEVPVPSAADVGFLAAVPLAIAAVICFWTPLQGRSERFRASLEGLNVVLCLIFTGWAFGLKEIVASPGTLAEHVIGLAYPFGDILVATVLILAIRRARRYDHGRMLLLLGGLAANSVADSAFAYMTATGNDLGIGNVIGMGWVIGYLMIALAAVWPKGVKDRLTDGLAIDLWQIALPWAVVLMAAIGALIAVLRGDTSDHIQTALAIAMAIVLMVLQITIHIDSLAVLSTSRRSEAMLSEVVAEAPIGIARTDTTFKIVGANPGLAALLRESPESLVGSPLARFIPPEAQTPLFEKLGALLGGDVRAQGETPLVRADGSHGWSRWTATAVRSSIAQADYVIATIEDITVMHEAQEEARTGLAVLKKLNQVKSEFLRSVGKEFKSALVEIQSFSEFMRNTDDLNLREARVFATDIYKNADRLDRMVADMLDQDRATTDGAGLAAPGADLDEIIREVEALSHSPGGVEPVGSSART